MAIILPDDLTSEEIRVLQEYRRLNAETLTAEQISAIRHPAGGGETPAVTLARKGWLTADPAGYALTERAKAFLAIEAKPLYEEAPPAPAAAPAAPAAPPAAPAEPATGSAEGP